MPLRRSLPHGAGTCPGPRRRVRGGLRQSAGSLCAPRCGDRGDDDDRGDRGDDDDGDDGDDDDGDDDDDDDDDYDRCSWCCNIYRRW